MQYVQNISKHICSSQFIFAQANSYLQYPCMSNDKYFNHAFNYCISDK
jgi:hypothetical protein